MFRLFSTAAIVLCLASIVGALPAAATRVRMADVDIANKSDRCAWFTVYESDPVRPWHILSSDNNRPRFLKPGESYLFPLEDWGGSGAIEVKVRAEVKADRVCGGGVVKDTYDIRKNPPGNHPKAQLVNSNNGYNLWFSTPE